MKKLLLSFAAVGLLFTANAVYAEVSEDLLPSDSAFETYVSPELFQKATESLDAELLTDVALQLAEGERVLQRPHQGISSEAVSRLAYRLAKDDSTKTRLKNAAEKAGNQKLVGEFANLDKAVKEALAGLKKPKFSVEDNPRAATLALYLLDFVEKAIRLQDTNLLDTYSTLPQELKDVLGEKVSKEFADYLTETKTKISDNPSEDNENLAKLEGVSRQVTFHGGWSPSNDRRQPPNPRPMPVPNPRPPQGNGHARIENGRIRYENPNPQFRGRREASNRQVPQAVRQLAEQIKRGQFQFNRPNTHGQAEFELGNGIKCYQMQHTPTTRQYNPIKVLLYKGGFGGLGQGVFPTSMGWYSPRLGIIYDQASFMGWGIAVVNYVQPFSPADDYGSGNGLQVDDIIYSVDNRRISTPFEFEWHIDQTDFDVYDSNTNWNGCVWLWLPLF